jgi:hypothetical protein
MAVSLIALAAVACEHERRPPPGTGEPCMTDADCPDGTYCAAVDGGIVCVLPSDTPIACGYYPFPRTGDACQPGELPEGYVCREFYCSMYCYTECTCNARSRWECNVACRDFGRPSDGGYTYPECGRPPLCRAWCSS